MEYNVSSIVSDIQLNQHLFTTREFELQEKLKKANEQIQELQQREKDLNKQLRCCKSYHFMMISSYISEIKNLNKRIQELDQQPSILNSQTIYVKELLEELDRLYQIQLYQNRKFKEWTKAKRELSDTNMNKFIKEELGESDQKLVEEQVAHSKTRIQLIELRRTIGIIVVSCKTAFEARKEYDISHD